ECGYGRWPAIICPLDMFRATNEKGLSPLDSALLTTSQAMAGSATGLRLTEGFDSNSEDACGRFVGHEQTACSARWTLHRRQRGRLLLRTFDIVPRTSGPRRSQRPYARPSAEKPQS